MEACKNKYLVWFLVIMAFLALNSLAGFLAYLVYGKGIGGELISYIITATILMDIGIVYGFLKSIGINIKMKKDKKEKPS